VRRERAERLTDGLTRAPGVGEGQREERGDRIVELVGGPAALGVQQLDALREAAEVAQRARLLDDRPAAAPR
jgi:hypothetical protein